MASWIWVLIPLAGILLGAFSEWLKFKEKQNKLGSSTQELEKTVEAQKQALEIAERRLQNLEAIVTTQMWDVVHDDTLPEAEKQRALAASKRDLALPDDEPSDAERTAQIARRLRA